jgi:hypothetical protein
MCTSSRKGRGPASFVGSLHSFGQSGRPYAPDPAASRLFMSSSHELTVGLQNKTRSLDSIHWNECIQDPFIQLQENVHVLLFILSSEVVPPDQHSWGTGLLEAFFSYLPAAPNWVLAQGVFFPFSYQLLQGCWQFGRLQIKLAERI